MYRFENNKLKKINDRKKILESNKNYYIFSTCRLAYIEHPEIKHMKLLKRLHTNYYMINNNNIITQPVNYTVKLRDVLDSILYLKGLYELPDSNDNDYVLINDIESKINFHQMFFSFTDITYVYPKTRALFIKK